MPESLQHGTWLLLDAAGPDLCTGLIRDDRWLAFRSTRDGFLESLKPSVEALLGESGMKLPDLMGCLVAAGPGSTLGLRLAAMFATALLQLDSLAHWRCLSYNNLSLACAASLNPSNPEPRVLLAPWRRDRFHRAEFAPSSGEFKLSGIEASSVTNLSLQCVILGNRASHLPDHVKRVPYPAQRIPEVLKAFPGLLVPSSAPVLYAAEETEFARWRGERHTAQ
jgi:tRNA A37 threonylcarbamoyladenosine modification protein TsaB